MYKKITLATVLLTSFCGNFAFGQWTKSTPQETISRKAENSIYYKLDIGKIRAQLSSATNITERSGAVTIEVPTLDGKMERFAVKSFPVLDEALAKQYQLGSFVGTGVDDPSKYIRFSVAPNDFQSMIMKDGVYEFIEPATKDKSLYGVHSKTTKDGKAFVCSTTEDPASRAQMQALQKEADKTKFARSSNKTFHTLRLAMSTTGEYTQFFGGRAGALAQVNTTITRVNAIFEQEFNIHLNVVDAPELIFTDPQTDPYTTVTSLYEPPTGWNNQLRTTLHGGKYGVTDDDFDIGHLFGASGGGGNAGCIGCVCNSSNNNNYKGRGITSPGVDFYNGGTTFNSTSTTQLPPSGDAFDIDYVAHEMGHQLGANHTYGIAVEDTGVEVEPGSGSTIMAYAGITGATTDVAHHSDPYFHSLSIDQVQAYMESVPGCGVTTPVTNNPPVVEPLPSFTIPKGTAFSLTGSATDPDGDELTYCWEEVDPLTSGKVTTSNIGNTTSGATFRSFLPTTSPTRYFPRIETVANGLVKNAKEFEAVSTVARTTHFRLTVRDNRPGGEAQTAYQEQTVVVGSAAAFKVNAAAGVAGEPVVITWIVSGTDLAPYNAPTVKIDYSTDNGQTWDILSTATGRSTDSVPNNGTAVVTFPASLGASTPLLRVSAIGNVFYAVNRVTLTAADLATVEHNKTKFEIYPNPVKETIFIKNISSKSTFAIYDASGRLVSQGNLNNDQIKVNSLLKGVYVLVINNGTSIMKSNFIKE